MTTDESHESGEPESRDVSLMRQSVATVAAVIVGAAVTVFLWITILQSLHAKKLSTIAFVIAGASIAGAVSGVAVRRSLIDPDADMDEEQ